MRKIYVELWGGLEVVSTCSGINSTTPGLDVADLGGFLEAEEAEDVKDMG